MHLFFVILIICYVTLVLIKSTARKKKTNLGEARKLDLKNDASGMRVDHGGRRLI